MTGRIAYYRVAPDGPKAFERPRPCELQLCWVPSFSVGWNNERVLFASRTREYSA
jgi:hypothetical protein